MRLTTSLPVVLEATFWDVGLGIALAHVRTEGFAVVALVGVQFFHSSLVHGCFSTNNVVLVTIKRHVGQWQTIFLCEQ